MAKFATWLFLVSAMSGVGACSSASDHEASPNEASPHGEQAQGVPGLSADPLQAILEGKPDAFTLRAAARAESRLSSDERAYLESLDLFGGSLTATALLGDPVFRSVVQAVLDELAASGSVGTQSVLVTPLGLHPLTGEAPADPVIVNDAVNGALAKVATGAVIAGGALTIAGLSPLVVVTGVVVGAGLIVVGVADYVNADIKGLLQKALQSFLNSAQADTCVPNRIQAARDCASKGLRFDGCRACVKASTPPMMDGGGMDASPPPTSCTAPSNGPCAGCSIGGCIAPAVASCIGGATSGGGAADASADGGEGGAPTPITCAKPASCTCLVK